MKLFYEKDADLSLLKGKRIAVLGAGSQGQAHALNLKDSGLEVVVGVREGPSYDKAKKAGLEVGTPLNAVAGADVVMFLVPDETHQEVYAEVEPNLKKGASLAFAHGFSVLYGQVKPRSDLNVFMIAPKGPGHLVRSTYVEGAGVPSLLAIHQDPSGNTEALGLAYACGIGATRAGVIMTSFKNETETDLFGEQTVLCGCLLESVKASFEVLTEAGYPPEIAYFECLHEVKLIADLLYQGGLSAVGYGISTTAKFGMYQIGPRLIDDAYKAKLRKVLADIQSGQYAKDFLLENKVGAPFIAKSTESLASHPIEIVGTELRSMMPWLNKSRIVDTTKN